MITLERVNHAYDGHPVLRDVDFHVTPGARLLVTGPSGGGKSTLLRILGLTEAPTHGRVLVDGRDAARFRDAELARHLRCTVGNVFQTHDLMPTLSVLDNVLLPARIANVTARDRARDLLRTLRIEHVATRYPDTLSVGQRARVALARALVTAPRVLIADEPTANLDDASTRLVADVLTSRLDDAQALVVATHDERLLRAFPDAERFELEDGHLTSSPTVTRVPTVSRRAN